MQEGRLKLYDEIKNYLSFNKREEEMRLEFLNFILLNESCFQRELLTGHITGSAWIINSTGDNALLMHHAKLHKWLQPGGHCDGNSDILQVTLKEVYEETKLKPEYILPGIFDLDIHLIPAHKSIPEHFHYDVRYLFIINEMENLQGNSESFDLKWVPLNEIKNYNSEESVIRMRDKCLMKQYSFG